MVLYQINDASSLLRSLRRPCNVLLQLGSSSTLYVFLKFHADEYPWKSLLYLVYP